MTARARRRGLWRVPRPAPYPGWGLDTLAGRPRSRSVLGPARAAAAAALPNWVAAEPRDSSLAARLPVTSELPVPVTQTPRQALSTLTGEPFMTARRKTTRRPASSRKHAALWPGFRVRADSGRASSPAASWSESTCDRSTVR
jgi:cell division septation protein DedD